MHHNFDGGSFAVLLVLLRNFVEGRPDLPGRIIGGNDARIEDFPYQVSLHYDGRHICGGTIIGSSNILTAAHCLDWKSEARMQVHVGSTNNNLGQVYKVHAFIIHDMYNSETFNNDIALIKLEKPLTFGHTVQPIQLPALNEPVRNVLAVVTGWGHIKENGTIVRALRQLSIPVIGRKRCQGFYEQIGNVTDKMICAGIVAGGHDSCQGDSGGPLVAKGKLVGIVSWGYGCARPTYPGVYTKVSKFINWITSKSAVI